jgi:hypothetical protein
MNFSEALKRLRLGAKLHRDAWTKGEYVYMEGETLFCHAFGYVKSFQDGEKVKIEQINVKDILAEDWVDPAE